MAKKILIVEDSPDSRELLQFVLEREGFDVELAEDGIEGIQQATKEPPDLIISDLSMPRIDGVRMIKRLRSLPKVGKIPILALTSHGLEKAMNAIRAGADRALTRPVENRLLISFVYDLLNRYPMGAAKTSV
jgi:CheY-like chemotaxis protein